MNEKRTFWFVVPIVFLTIHATAPLALAQLSPHRQQQRDIVEKVKRMNRDIWDKIALMNEKIWQQKEFLKIAQEQARWQQERIKMAMEEARWKMKELKEKIRMAREDAEIKGLQAKEALERNKMLAEQRDRMMEQQQAFLKDRLLSSRSF